MAAGALSGVLNIPAAVAGGALPTDKECSKLKPADAETKGWCTAINRRKGNCLACHMVTTKKPWPAALPPGGNIAPPLVSMKQRFPDKAKLKAQVWDATKNNPQSSMPPFGRHKLLSEGEIDAIVAWLYTI
jgi:sulfur-oxidizing protein SoxX